MRIAIIGGGLQGVEATYLASKAGWETCVVDRKADVPASGLCDRFVQCDVTRSSGLNGVLSGVDFVLPALENHGALKSLAQWARQSEIPFMFDESAYAVSSSKVESNRLFERLNLPMPLDWPDCGLPVVLKPAAGSGSRGVRILDDTDRLQACFQGDLPPEGWVLQEFLPGPVYSLEVIGYRNEFKTLHVTDLALDSSFDCKRVSAPARLSPEAVQTFENMALAIAKTLELNGIMDLEVIHDGEHLKILEIDARFPSQTPMAVFGASGLNMVEVLGHLFSGRCSGIPPVPPLSRGSILEQVHFRDGLLETGGEHLMASAGPLHREYDFFGADEAITNYTAGRSDWVATLIIRAADGSEAWCKRNRVIENIMNRCPVRQYSDFEPVHQIQD
jgi:pyrrolysine biosynthesis protein PylC